MAYSFDVSEFFVRLTKYLLEGTVVAVAAYFIPRVKLGLDEILIIALTAACVLSLLDFFAPSIGDQARSGMGFGIGANIVGFPVNSGWA
jgi:hypothetical protein